MFKPKPTLFAQPLIRGEQALPRMTNEKHIRRWKKI